MKSKTVYDNIEIKRRKQDGVFHTPEYIADFMCRTTIFSYLSKEGAENINDLISEYQEEIGILDRKLRSIKLLDPACGCGVFLIKAVDLIVEIAKEIKLIKELGGRYKQIKNNQLESSKEIQFDVDNWEREETRQIIENSIYGVDINENSVEKTKGKLLSKLSRQDRSLLDLSQNIKCGDSLIEEPSLKGDKAFIWSQNFEKILKKGGFDIIIGNPPYINIIEDLKSKNYYKKRFPEIYTGKSDIYYYFFQKAIELSKRNGHITFIAPRYLMEAFEARKLREYILKETAIQKIIDFSDFKIFGDANIDTAIYFLKKTYAKKEIIVYKLVKQITPPLRLEPPFFQNYCIYQHELTGNKWYFIDPEIQTLLDKIYAKSTGKLKDYSVLSKGIQTGKDSVFVITMEKAEKYAIEKDILSMWLKNSQIRRFSTINPFLFVITSNRNTINELSSYPNLEKYLKKYKKELLNRARVNKWFHWRKGDERFTIDWNKPKIITPYKSAYNNFAIDDRGCYFSQDIVLIIPKEEIDIRYLLSFLNSKLCEFYFKIKGKRLGAVYDYYPRQIEGLPFLKIDKKEQEVFAKIVDRLLELHRLSTQKFLIIQNRMSVFNIDLNKNFLKFKEKDMNEFFNEIEKKRKLNFLSIQREEIEEFLLYRLNEIFTIEKEINQAENELNRLTYQLFDLNDEEIRLIETSFSQTVLH